MSARAERQPDVLVVGGGLHGCSAALHLARAGVKPLVLEQTYAGRHASGVNAGGVRQLGRDPAEIPLSVASMALWHDIRGLVDDDCGFVHSGQVKVAETEADMASIRRRAEDLRRLGFTHEEVIGREELRELLPAVSPHCVGGMVSRRDGFANPFRTVTAFRRAVEAAGGIVREGARVRRVERRGGLWHVVCDDGAAVQAPVLVNCAGAWGAGVAAQMGDRVPLRAEAPMLMISERMAPFVRPVVGATSRTLSFKQFANGTVLIGGGHRGIAHPEEEGTTLDLAALRTNAVTAYEIFPVMRHARIIRAWAGIEAVTPDALPVIGPSCHSEAAFHAFGFSAHGFQLGPIVGRIIADLVMRGHTDLPLAPFRADRFPRAATESGTAA